MADAVMTQPALQVGFGQGNFASKAPGPGKRTTQRTMEAPSSARPRRATFSRLREKVCHAYLTGTTARWPSFARRLGLDGQGVHAGIELGPHEMIDRAMTLDQTLAL